MKAKSNFEQDYRAMHSGDGATLFLNRRLDARGWNDSSQ